MSSDGNLDTESVGRPKAFLGRISSEVRSAAARICQESAGQRILDVGCGNGLLFAEIGDIHCTFFGMDADAQLLGEARQILYDNKVGPAIFALGDACHLPYRDESFDKALLLNTLINIPTDDLVTEFLHELIRITRSGEKIIVDIRNNANWILRTRYWLHNQRADFKTRGYALGRLRDLFTARGCEIRATHSIGPWLPFGPCGIVIEAEKRVD